MKILSLALFLAIRSVQADPVDALVKKYEKARQEALHALNSQKAEELKLLRDKAMENKNLKLANKADSEIKLLEGESAGKVLFPASSDYQMTWCSNQRYTENGKEIICRFRCHRPIVPGKKLQLMVIAADKKDSGTKSEIFILDGSKGKVVGSIAELGKGAAAVVPLAMEASIGVELAIVVKNSDAVVFQSFNNTAIPTLLLNFAN